MSNRRLIAHRGWQHRFPENTLPAITGAIDCGGQCIEVDIQLSADGVPYLFHDENLERLCGETGAIHDYNSAQLDQFRAAESGRLGIQFEDCSLCKLSEAVDVLKQFPAIDFFVEIKDIATKHFGVSPVYRAISEALLPMAEQCILISFDWTVLAEARRQGWRHRLGPVLNDWQEWQHPLWQNLAPDLVFCDADIVPPDCAMASLPCPVAVYEIGDANAARYWFSRGAHWVETYCIGDLVAELAEAEGQAILS